MEQPKHSLLRMALIALDEGVKIVGDGEVRIESEGFGEGFVSAVKAKINVLGKLV